MKSVALKCLCVLFILCGSLGTGWAQRAPNFSGDWIAEDGSGRSLSIAHQPPRLSVTYNWIEAPLHDEGETLEFNVDGAALSRQPSPHPSPGPPNLTFEAKRVGNAIIVIITQAGRAGTSSIDIFHMAGPDKLGVVMVRGVLGQGEHTMISGTLAFSRQ